jgi:hypothetical protein
METARINWAAAWAEVAGATASPTTIDHLSASTKKSIQTFLNSWERFIEEAQPEMMKHDKDFIKRSPDEAFRNIGVNDIQQYLLFRVVTAKNGHTLQKSTVETYYKTLQMTYLHTTQKEIGRFINIQVNEVSFYIYKFLPCFRCRANK